MYAPKYSEKDRQLNVGPCVVNPLTHYSLVSWYNQNTILLIFPQITVAFVSIILHKYFELRNIFHFKNNGTTVNVGQ